MSKVKGVEEEEWKHATDPLTQADLRVEEGEPQLSPKHNTDRNITLNVSFHRIDAVYRHSQL